MGNISASPATDLASLLEVFPLNPQTAFVSLWLVAAAVVDFKTHRIPNLLTVSGVAAALASQFGCLGWSGLTDGFAGFCIGLGFYLPLYAAGWMGAGDVKLMAAAGTFLGGMAAFLAVCLSTVVGVIISIGLLVARGGMGEYLSRYGLMFRCLFRTGRCAYVGPRPGAPAATRFSYAFAICLGTLGTLGWNGGFDPLLRLLAEIAVEQAHSPGSSTDPINSKSS